MTGMKNINTGFTLVEVIVVMVIIAIIAAVAFPIFKDYKDQCVEVGSEYYRIGANPFSPQDNDLIKVIDIKDGFCLWKIQRHIRDGVDSAFSCPTSVFVGLYKKVDKPKEKKAVKKKKDDGYERLD